MLQIEDDAVGSIRGDVLVIELHTFNNNREE